MTDTSRQSEIHNNAWLTHCGLVTPNDDINLGQEWLRYWLGVVRQDWRLKIQISFIPYKYSCLHPYNEHSAKRVSEWQYIIIWRLPLKPRSHCHNSHQSEYDIYLEVSFIKIIGKQGPVSIRKTVLPGMAIPMLKTRRPNGRLIFNMEIAIRK